MTGQRQPTTRRLLIAQRLIAPYRIPFYERLRAALDARGIELTVAYGATPPGETHPHAPLEWGVRLQPTYIRIGQTHAVWLPIVRILKSMDAVIVQQGNANLVNHALLVLRHTHGFALGMWGHGRNFQSEERGISEWLKRQVTPLADHWFAYTEGSARVLRSHGCPASAISVVNNTVDTAVETATLDEIDDARLAHLRMEHRLPPNAVIAICCTRLYREKRIDFLLRAAQLIRQRIPQFYLVVVGEGQESEKVRAAMARGETSPIRWVGPHTGREKAQFFALARCQLMPGPVGLHIVDSFAMGVPLVTTDIPSHGPEIEYLENGRNGLLTVDDEQSYANAVANVLLDVDLHKELVQGCQRAKSQYTIGHMVDRFSNGVEALLSRR